MKLSDIKPYEKNAKLHSQQQIEKIANSIKEYGFNQPIVVDKNGVIVVGHGRYQAAKKLGMEEVPTITAELSEPKLRAYRIADNKLNESNWDIPLMLDELKELKDLDFNIEDLGFDKDILDLEFNFQNKEMSPENVKEEHNTKACPQCGYEF